MGIMKHLVGVAAAAILVLAVTGVSTMAVAQGGPPMGGPPMGGPPMGGPGDMMTTMMPRGKRSPHHDPTHMTTTMGPRAKRSPQNGADCPPPPHGPPPNGPPPHGPPPCAPPSDTNNSPGGNEAEGAADTIRQKRSPQNPPDQSESDSGSDMSRTMPTYQIPNGNMGKVSNVIISTN